MRILVFIESMMPTVEAGILLPFNYMLTKGYIAYFDLLSYYDAINRRRLPYRVNHSSAYVSNHSLYISLLGSYYDLFIFVRACGKRAHQELLIPLKSLKKKIVYFVDDDFSLLPMDNAYQALNPKVYMPLYFRDSDVSFVFSDYMYNKYKKYNQNIVKMPALANIEIIDELRKKVTGEVHSNIRIGYGAHKHHINSLRLCEQALLTMLNKYPNISVELLFDPGPSLSSFRNVCIHNIPYMNLYQYYEFILSRNWDIAIAPLLDIEFNYAKSNNKYREYGALRIAGIYSNIMTYSTSVEHQKTGLLANNTTDEWTRMLDLLICDHNLRKSIVDNAYKDVKDKYSMDVVVSAYWSCLAALK